MTFTVAGDKTSSRRQESFIPDLVLHQGGDTGQLQVHGYWAVLGAVDPEDGDDSFVDDHTLAREPPAPANHTPKLPLVRHWSRETTYSTREMGKDR